MGTVMSVPAIREVSSPTAESGPPPFHCQCPSEAGDSGEELFGHREKVAVYGKVELRRFDLISVQVPERQLQSALDVEVAHHEAGRHPAGSIDFNGKEEGVYERTLGESSETEHPETGLDHPGQWTVGHHTCRSEGRVGGVRDQLDQSERRHLERNRARGRVRPRHGHPQSPRFCVERDEPRARLGGRGIDEPQERRAIVGRQSGEEMREDHSLEAAELIPPAGQRIDHSHPGILRRKRVYRLHGARPLRKIRRRKAVQHQSVDRFEHFAAQAAICEFELSRQDVSAPHDHDVVSRSSPDDVRAQSPNQAVGLCVTVEHVRASPSYEQVRTKPPTELVAPCGSEQGVGPGTACEEVVSLAAAEQVVARVTDEDIVAISAPDNVVS